MNILTNLFTGVLTPGLLKSLFNVGYGKRDTMKTSVTVGLLVFAAFALDCLAESCVVFPRPIEVATWNGDIETVKRLLDEDPKLMQEGKGYSLLSSAATTGQEKIVRLLISRGASLGSNSIAGACPLHIVAATRRKEIAGIFLDSGADIDALDRVGRTALQIAASRGQLEMATFLGSRGAKVDVFSAAALGDLAKVREFLHKHPDSITNKSPIGIVGTLEYGGMTLLEFGTIGGSKELVELLIRKGADVNAAAPVPVPVYPSPLHEAAQFGRSDVAALLIANGARIDSTNYHGEMPIHFAARYGTRAVLEKLIECGADANVRAWEGMTPLHYAALSGNTNAAQCLLDHKVDVNARAAYAQTPLRVAIG